MIKAIELENFKAFGKPAAVNLAPITLIFGENSSGKSSILQSLNVLKQTRESREVGALLLPRTDHGFVDLGSFQELIFDHDHSKKLKIKITFDVDGNSLPDFITEILQKNKLPYVLSIELVFHRPKIEEEVIFDELKLFIGNDYDPIATFSSPISVTDDIKKNMFHQLLRRGRRSSHSKMRYAKCNSINTDSKYWVSSYNYTKKHASKTISYLKNLEERIKGISISKAHQEYLFSDISIESANDKASQLKEVKAAIKFYESDFTLRHYIERMQDKLLHTYIGLDGFIPTVSTSDSRSTFPEEGYFPSDRHIAHDMQLDVGRLAIIAGRYLDSNLELLFPLGPFRRPPERWYIFTGTSPQDVGYRGELLPDYLFRNPELVTEANDWLKKLDIGYSLKIESIGAKAKDLFEVRLVDKRRSKKVEVGLSDVGFGISQILPFIVQSLASSNNIISIEQPEVHIHPRLQADLGDLLAHCINKPRNNQFIIETHSEHLILRLQKLIRKQILKPSDVSIVYVSRGKESAVVTELGLNSTGEFLVEWPGGFFPERLRELR